MSMSVLSDATHNRFRHVWQALEARRYFKLICGGSFSDPDRLEQLIRIYAETGLEAIDIAAALPVVEAALRALPDEALRPLLMVSFPLDADPHFRKIELAEAACVRCGLCVPVCPTRVFDLPSGGELQLDVPVCYGCGRCMPICPTDALHLDGFSVRPDLLSVLANPGVDAVEIHTTYADPLLISTLYAELGEVLHSKMISVCLRPQTLPSEQVTTFLQDLKARTPFPMIVQVDGSPMSGSEDPEASRSALEAARVLALKLPKGCYLTISGGINAFTAKYLKEPQYESIHGVGMGTVARQKVWDVLGQPEQALRIAESLVHVFRSGATSAII